MAIYKITYHRIEYQKGRLVGKVFLGAILIGELKYLANTDRLERLGHAAGLNTDTTAHELLAIQTQDLTIGSLLNRRTMTDTITVRWNITGAESV